MDIRLTNMYFGIRDLKYVDVFTACCIRIVELASMHYAQGQQDTQNSKLD